MSEAPAHDAVLTLLFQQLRMQLRIIIAKEFGNGPKPGRSLSCQDQRLVNAKGYIHDENQSAPDTVKSDYRWPRPVRARQQRVRWGQSGNGLRQGTERLEGQGIAGGGSHFGRQFSSRWVDGVSAFRAVIVRPCLSTRQTRERFHTRLIRAD